MYFENEARALSDSDLASALRQIGSADTVWGRNVLSGRFDVGQAKALVREAAERLHSVECEAACEPQAWGDFARHVRQVTFEDEDGCEFLLPVYDPGGFLADNPRISVR